MRKYFILFVSFAVMTLAADEIFAQSRYGVIGGATFSTSNFKEMNRATMTQWHAGLTYKLDLPLGFSVQPSLMYQVKGAKMHNVLTDGDKFDVNIGYVELPVSFQWGPDLLIFRPFLDVTPYIGYGINNKLMATSGEGQPVDVMRNRWSSAGIRRVEYGMGLGVGIEVWRIQLVGRYNWNFGSLYEDTIRDNETNFVNIVESAFNRRNFGGFTLSAAILFGGK